MRISIRIATLLALILVALAAGCGGGDEAAAPGEEQGTAAAEESAGDLGDVTLGYAAPGLVGGQRDILTALETWAEEKGWKVNVANSEGDAQRQVSQIESFVAAGVDAIVAVPQDSVAVCAGVQAAKRANIPFYTIDRAPIGCEIGMSVLSDNYLAGKQAGEAMVALLEERYGEPRGKVLEVTGELTQNVAQLRGSGFQDVIKEYPDIELITKEGNWDAALGQQIVRDIATANPDLDGIYFHSDAVYTPGTLAVLRELGKLKQRGEDGHIFLAGVDGSPAGVQAIKDGWADQSSGQPIPDFGLIVRFIEQELKGEKVAPGVVEEEGALWSPATIEETPEGLSLILPTTNITIDNADDPGLWANQASGD